MNVAAATVKGGTRKTKDENFAETSVLGGMSTLPLNDVMAERDPASLISPEIRPNTVVSPSQNLHPIPIFNGGSVLPRKCTSFELEAPGEGQAPTAPEDTSRPHADTAQS